MTQADDELGGHWQMVRAEFDGESVPELITTKTCLELAGDRYAITFDGEIADAGRLTVGETPSHGTLTLKCVTGANDGRTILAIYQHVGNRLRICFAFEGAAPSAFTSVPGSKLYLAAYRRAES